MEVGFEMLEDLGRVALDVEGIKWKESAVCSEKEEKRK